MGTLKWWAGIALGAAVCGCGGESAPPTTESVALDLLNLTADVKSNGSVILASVKLFDAEYQSVTVAGGDRLLLTAGGVEEEMVPFDGDYIEQIATSATDCAIVLARGDGARITSEFPLPPPFALYAPADPASLSAPFTFTWDADPGEHETRIEVSSPCFSLIQRSLTGDPGTYTIQPADLALSTASYAGTCDVDVVVTRLWARGVIAAELSPSDPVFTSQVRTTRFSASP